MIREIQCDRRRSDPFLAEPSPPGPKKRSTMKRKLAMDTFTRQNLKQLTAVDDDPALSIYMPTRRSGREVRQNPIRFKNVMKQASAQLSERAAQGDAIRRMLGKASSLEMDEDWWQHQSDGMAMFLAADHFACYRVPLSFSERVVVGKRFYVRPMIRLLQGDGRFYVLAVSQNRVRLLEGTQFAVSELDAQGLPSDLRSALNIDEYVSSLQQHSVQPHATADATMAGSMMFHGQGGSDPDIKKKDEIIQYFRRINAALSDFLDNARVPLVFAGVGYLFPLFQQACDHKALVKTPVTGNPDHWKPEQIHAEAWAIVEPSFRRDREMAWQRYLDSAHSETATDDLETIIQAACMEQIDTLLVAEDAEQWGVVDPQTGAVVSLQADAVKAEELINLAVVQTLTHGGTVYCFPRDHFDGERVAAAVLRYS